MKSKISAQKGRSRAQDESRFREKLNEAAGLPPLAPGSDRQAQQDEGHRRQELHPKLPKEVVTDRARGRREQESEAPYSSGVHPREGQTDQCGDGEKDVRDSGKQEASPSRGSARENHELSDFGQRYTCGSNEGWPGLSVSTRVPCPCLSGSWRDWAGVFILNDD